MRIRPLMTAALLAAGTLLTTAPALAAPAPAPEVSLPAPVPSAAPAVSLPAPGATTSPAPGAGAPLGRDGLTPADRQTRTLLAELAAMLAGVPLTVGAGLLLAAAARARRSRRELPPRGRHRAPRRPSSAAPAAAAPAAAPASASPADVNPDGLAPVDLEDLKALDLGLGPEPEPLRRSPLTGQDDAAPRTRPAFGSATTAAPTPRTQTSSAAATAGFEAMADRGERTPPALVTARQLSAPERANLLARAWQDRDTEALAALAGADRDSALAAHVLAAATASAAGDPRAFGYLQAAFTDGRDPHRDRLLAPHLDQLSFHVTADDLGLAEALPCSRTAIGCALACAERAAGDSESAYGVLLELPEVPLVRVLRAQAALDLNWPARALRIAWADAGDPDADRLAAVFQTLRGAALLASGQPGPAVTALDEALEQLLADPELAGGEPLRQRALFERALAHAASDNATGAWEDLTLLLAENPHYPEAAELLKQL